jgi:hypothetical protein
MTKKKNAASAKLSGSTGACRHGPFDDRCGVCDPSLGPEGARPARQALLELAAEVQDLVVCQRVGSKPKLLDAKASAVWARIGALSDILGGLPDNTARAEGLREGARMVAAKSDLLRKTRGGINKACFELDCTVQDLVLLADKVSTGKATVTDDHDDARQAMQVIVSSVGNIRARVGREHAIGAKVTDDVARIERNIERLDATIRRIEQKKGR